VLALGLGILAADQTASHLVKPIVERPRPCNVLEGVLTPMGPRSSLSFPSSHGANMGTALVLLLLTFGRWGWVFLPVALASGLSRVYLGLHYPSDVAGGYLLGAGIGWGVWWVVEKMKSRSHPPAQGSSGRPARGPRRSKGRHA
jgi:undecaprenyl-diphosphatase